MGIQETTPPWHDDVEGKLLENKKVHEAMEKERASLRECCVYDGVPAAKAAAVWNHPDATVLRSRWVKVLKAD
eukprot:9622673-Heterocapsa_arctica.AAC.1